MDLELSIQKPDEIKKKAMPLWIYKWINYEYWPWWMMYTFVIPYYLYLALKARNLFFFTNVNPSILHGGFKNYDKLKIQELIPAEYQPYTLRVEPNDFTLIDYDKVTFPVVVKPVNGERGRLIRVIYELKVLKDFLSSMRENFIIQEFLTHPYEATALWVNHPKKGKLITSFTTKEMMTVVGNGIDTIDKLLQLNNRYKLQINRLRLNDKLDLQEVLPFGKTTIIELIGNHCRGTKFINSNHLINEELVDVFSEISDKIPDFYYGRFDFKYSTLEELYQGKHIKIIELNGVSSDPAHVFDQKTGFLQSLKDICTHLNMLYDISEENLKKGFKRARVWDVIGVMKG